MDESTSNALHGLAASQHGLVHSRQAAALGVSSAALARAVRSGRWLWASPLVVKSAAAPDTVQSRTWLALLDAGFESLLSHGCAAAWWGANGFDREPTHVLLPRFDKPRRQHIAVVHRTRSLAAFDITSIDGLPITTPSRTVFDLASSVHPKRVERVLDWFWARGLVNAQSLSEVLTHLRGRGRKGVALMRDLINARRDGYTPFESGLEQRFEDLLRTAGVPVPDRQVEICDGGGFVARVDYVYRQFLIAIFIDSDRFHTAKLDREHDRGQTLRLERMGYRVMHVVEHDVRFEGSRVVEAICRVIDERTGVDFPAEMRMRAPQFAGVGELGSIFPWKP